MKELVVISGKGGTGKTSIALSLAVCADKRCVVADCDVDAADMHCVLQPVILKKSIFVQGKRATVDPAKCTGCQKCRSLCRFGAITCVGEPAVCTIDPVECEGCGVCFAHCPHQAIIFEDQECGWWAQSQTRVGPLVHASLYPGAENSGKLVSRVRRRAVEIAQETAKEFVCIDGSPGIGCPVIASLTGATLALVVTEPTVSGMHDLARIVQLTRRLDVPVVVCVNRWDLNREMADTIGAWCDQNGITFVKIGYSSIFSEAMHCSKAVVECDDTTAGNEIRALWRVLEKRLLT